MSKRITCDTLSMAELVHTAQFIVQTQTSNNSSKSCAMFLSICELVAQHGFPGKEKGKVRLKSK